MEYSQFGRTYVAIPGPSVVPDRVLNAMHQASPDIYSKEFQDLTYSVLQDLKKVVRTSGNVALYIANGHGVWEAAISNLFNPDDQILVLSTGTFAAGWGGFASAMGVNVETIDFGIQSDIDLSRVEERLKCDLPGKIKAVLTVHVDTASSVRNDIQNLANLIKELDHPALLLVDCIASLACDDFHMDDWGADLVIAGSQKGLMLPPGVAFVYFNNKAFKIGSNSTLRTPYWDWNKRINPEEFYQIFCGTAPTQHVFGLRESLDMILHEEGLENTIERHNLMAKVLWAAIDAWGNCGRQFQFNITDPNKRSRAVTSIRIESPYGQKLRNWTSKNAGVSLGIGLGMSTPQDPNASGAFRIGHMGHINPNMLLGLLGSIEAGLEAIGYNCGQGALVAATKELSKL